MTAFVWGFFGASMAQLNSPPQYITLTFSGTSTTATISSVSTANTILVFNGINTGESGNSAQTVAARWELTNSTTVTATKIGAGSLNLHLIVYEFTPGLIISQEMTNVAVSVSGGVGGTGTDTISSVNPNKTLIIPYGCTATSASGASSALLEVIWALNSATQTQCTIGGSFSSGTVTAYANVVQTG